MKAATSHSDAVVRRSDTRGEYLEIPLTKGQVACIDLQDAAVVLQYPNWVTRVVTQKKRTLYYAIHNVYENGGRTCVIQMHRLIMNAPPGVQVDHANWDGLCNRRFNLRFADYSEQGSNRRFELPGTGFRGVHHDKRKPKHQKCYYAEICVRGKNIYSSYFDKPEEAADAYDEMVKQHQSEFGITNKMLRELAAGKKAS